MERLADERRREPKHRTDYAYSLEEFGLEEDSIRNELGDLFERFGWEAAGDAPMREEPMSP